MRVTIPFFKGSDTRSTRDNNPSRHARRGSERRHFLRTTATVLVAIVSLAVGPAAIADQGRGTGNNANQQWVASWATSPAAYFVYAAPIAQNQTLEFSATKSAVANVQPDLAFPFPNSKTTGAAAVDQTFRSIVKPDLWDNSMRVRFSNVFGDQPLTLNATTVGLQEYAGNVVQGTITTVTFGGAKTVTIPAGEEVWSDGIRLSWVDRADDPLLQGRNLAVSYSVQGNSGHMTHHSGANVTSFISAAGSGDHTQDVDGFAYEYTTT
jgi:hypothetical protein